MSKAEFTSRVSYLTAQLADTERALAQELDRLNRVRGLVVRWRNNGAISYASQLQGALDDSVIFTDPLVPKRVPAGLSADDLVTALDHVLVETQKQISASASQMDATAWNAVQEGMTYLRQAIKYADVLPSVKK